MKGKYRESTRFPVLQLGKGLPIIKIMGDKEGRGSSYLQSIGVLKN